MIPVLIAAGVLTTGASVFAYQLGGVSSKPEENRPHDRPVGATTQGTRPTPAGSSTPQGEVQIARQILDELQKVALTGELNDPKSYHTWSLRLLEAEKRESPENSPPAAAYEGHVQRMTRMLQTAEKRAKAGHQSSYDIARWKYFAKEAERMLEDAKKPNPGGMMMGNMMSRMMSGGGMMRGAMGTGIGGSGGPPVEKPIAAEGAPNAGTQAQPQGSQSKPQGGGGGGFGGGSDESGAAEQAARIQIARMSAVISTLDKNPQNIAVIKKLEEPVTCTSRWPPLEEVLKHVKDATKGADGKRLSIYVDPQALQKAEKTMTSPVVIDLEDVPLRFCLRLVLKQLGLAYCIRDGVVMINTVDGIQQELREAQAEQMGLNPDK